MMEWCLVTKAGTVINMCMKYDGTAPELNDYQKNNGWVWVPVESVSPFNLRQYRYWNERP
jgi:hypothetical protein